MTTYDNNMTGILSKNTRKDSDKHPDIKGSCEIDGVQYWMDGWAKTRNSDGGKFYSMRFKLKEQAQDAPQQAAKPASAPGGFDDMDGDIPF